MIPLYILKEDVELPSEGTYYIVAKNGVFLHKDTGLIEATVKVDHIPFLQELTPTATLRLPKLSPKLMVRALLFFRRVYQQYHSEAAVLLHYSPENHIYRLHCPEQSVSADTVHYDASDRFDGYQLVGTIHSHASMVAFHSGVDDHDEQHFDGLHITVGRLDQPYFTVSCSAVVNGQRFHLVPENNIIGITEVDWQPTNRITYRRTEVPEVQSTGFFDFRWLDFEGAFDVMEMELRHQFYDMALPDGQDYRHVSVPTSWLDRVSKTRPNVWTGLPAIDDNGNGQQIRQTQSWRQPHKHERRTIR